ncbi:MAG: hypothetical protein ACOYOM_14205 [Chloroflexota bacterium]|jgi:hypothetical protein
MTANPTLDTRPVVAAISDLVPGATSPWQIGTAVQALPVGASATAILHALIDDRVDADLCDTDVDSFLARNPDLAFASVDDLLGDDWA